MKKNLLTIVVSVVLALIFVLILFVFQVRQSEVAVVTRFGKPVRAEDQPGAYFRLPPGIESVYKLDQRIQNFEDVQTETYTADGNNLLTSVYVGWRVADATAFFPKFRNGSVKRFKFPVRTTPVGSIDPYGNKPQAGDLKDQRFFTEDGKTLPTLSA